MRNWMMTVALCCLLSPVAYGFEPLASIWVSGSNPDLVAELAERYEVKDKEDGGYVLLLPPADLVSVLNNYPGIRVVEKNIYQQLEEAIAADPTYLDGYRSFDEIEQVLQKFVTDYPAIASLEEYGQSANGRSLYALKISDNVAENETEPELMLTASTHGDELITVEVLVRLVEKMLVGYGTNDRFTDMVDNVELFIIPVVNPDGFVRQSRYANGADPNRAYPWPERPSRSPVACVANVMSFFHNNDIAGGLDFHASGQMVMYPWAWTYDPVDSADELVFRNLGTAMAEENGYAMGQISRIIYVAKGSSADYYYWKTGALTYGIELATSKVPPSSRIPNVVDEAEEMTWRFVEHFYQ